MKAKTTITVDNDILNSSIAKAKKEGRTFSNYVERLLSAKVKPKTTNK